MKITRKKQVIWERERRVTIKLSDASVEKYCSGCRANAQFVSVDEAAAVKQMSARQIFRLVEAGEIHFSETADGKLFVCLRSLSGTTGDKTVFLTGNVEE